MFCETTSLISHGMETQCLILPEEDSYLILLELLDVRLLNFSIKLSLPIKYIL